MCMNQATIVLLFSLYPYLEPRITEYNECNTHWGEGVLIYVCVE